MIATERLTHVEPPKPGTVRFRADVIRGLSARPKALPCKYFYDRAGSELFEQITLLPEYYLTRTELGIMQAHAGAMAERLGRRVLLVEYGSGSGVKTRLLLKHLEEPAGYVPVDVSDEHLWHSAARLSAEFPRLEVLPLFADFTRPFGLPAPRRRQARTAVYFPGSTIGNFTPDDAVILLRQAARLCGPGGAMLLGADLRKDPAIIEAAYNDGRGVTAAFNKNILRRINRELGGDFDLNEFDHHAAFNAAEGRVEISLVSRVKQVVTVGAEEFGFAAGEPILTEYSHKYEPQALAQLVAAGGFTTEQVWTDADRYFSVSYLTVSG
jgi:dimethylhistidine N-methyltransferase